MIAMAGTPPGWMSIKDAARLYEMPHWTIRTWISRGKIRAEKQKRGRILVNRGDIEEMLRSEPLDPRAK